MPFLLRLIQLLQKVLQFRLLAPLLVLHFVLFWGMLLLCEEQGSKILEPINFWYFWATTGLTIGYGDLSPQSNTARLFTPFFQASGIVLVTMLLTLCVQSFTEQLSKRRRGLMPTKASQHILVLGDYHPVQTPGLIREAVADRLDDGHTTTCVVGCFRNLGDKNPFEQPSEYPATDLTYIQAGTTGFNQKTLLDAGADRAAQIYICTNDDAAALGLLSILSRIGTSARIVVLLREEESRESVPVTMLDVHVILPVQTMLAVREMGDPGTGAAIQELLTIGGMTLYSIELSQPDTISYQLAKETFGSHFPNAILMGICTMGESSGWVSTMNPDPETKVRGNDRLVYMAKRDIQPDAERAFQKALLAS